MNLHPRRFYPAVLIGGGGAGLLIAVPVLGDVLRCALCLGVVAGSAGSMKLWLDTHLAENLTPIEGAYLGAVSGLATAGVSWVLSVPIRVAFGDGLGDFYMGRSALPEFAKYLLRALYTADFGNIIMTLFLQVIVYGAMGALGGFLALRFLFPARRDDRVED